MEELVQQWPQQTHGCFLASGSQASPYHRDLPLQLTSSSQAGLTSAVSPRVWDTGGLEVYGGQKGASMGLGAGAPQPSLRSTGGGQLIVMSWNLISN